ncbi:MAG: hypothetical protein V3V81_07565 [Candidatus Bathyarchaeia archaeon]
MTDLQKRLDKYINCEHADPLAIGLIAELRSHLKAANRGAALNANIAYSRWQSAYELEKRIIALENHQAGNTDG